MQKQYIAKGLECHSTESTRWIAQAMGNSGRIPDEFCFVCLLCFLTVPMMRERGIDRRRESFEAERLVIRGYI